MRLGAAHMTINTSHQRLLLSLTQENAVDLHNVGSSLTLPAMVGRKNIDPVKNKQNLLSTAHSL